MEKVSTLIELIIEFRVKIMGTNSKSTNKCLIISEKKEKGVMLYRQTGHRHGAPLLKAPWDL